MDRVSLTNEALGINLPYSMEAEQAVLGAIIINSPVLYEIMPILAPEHFFHNQNRAIFHEIVLLFTAGSPIDFITVTDAVATAKIFDTVEETKLYLFNVTQTIPTIANVTTYARIVYEKYLVRSLINSGREIIEHSSTNEDAMSMLDFAEQKIFEIRTGRNTSELYKMDSVLLDTLDQLQKLSGPDRAKYLGIATGFTLLDNLLTGLNKSDLIVLAARPSVGKTALALNIATNVIKNYDCDVAFFSLEMTANQLVSRILSSETKVNASSFITGNIASDEWSKIAYATERLAKSNLYFDDTSGITVNEIKAKARRLKNIGLIIVDYLQLMGGNSRHESRVQEISEITRAFKIMAKELNVPVILLSQLNRSTEKQGRRPMLSDLRDSGSIEQDSDVVMFLHRENPDLTDDGSDDDLPENAILLLIAKNRHGEVGKFYLHWDKRYTLFTSMEMSYDD